MFSADHAAVAALAKSPALDTLKGKRATRIPGSWVWLLLLPMLSSFSYAEALHLDHQPSQQLLLQPVTWSQQGFILEAVADFSLEARVLSIQGYEHDLQAPLSPLDLALGWGPMSDPQILTGFNIWQQDRWFYWQTDLFPIPRAQVERSASNVHIIPAIQAWVPELLALRSGQRVRLQGMLVNVYGEHDWQWLTSLSRDDTGDGACEILWLTSWQILEDE